MSDGVANRAREPVAPKKLLHLFEATFELTQAAAKGQRMFLARRGL
jgi:hypothetical protein